MFKITFRAPRSPEDYEAAFTVTEAQSSGPLIVSPSRICQVQDESPGNGLVVTASHLDTLLDKLGKKGQVTRVYIFNRTECDFGKSLCSLLCSYVKAKGMFASYSENQREI